MYVCTSLIDCNSQPDSQILQIIKKKDWTKSKIPDSSVFQYLNQTTL